MNTDFLENIAKGIIICIIGAIIYSAFIFIKSPPKVTPNDRIIVEAKGSEWNTIWAQHESLQRIAFELNRLNTNLEQQKK